MVAAVAEFERLYVRPNRGRTLVVGSYVTSGKIDRRTLYADALGVDMRAGPGVDLVANLEEPQEIGRFDHVECLSVLEHSPRPWLLAKNLERMMNPGATIYIAVPFNWRVHNHPDDYFRMSAAGVRSLFPAVEWRRLMYATYGGLIEKPIIPCRHIDGHRFYARSVTCGFGVRR